MCNRDKKSNKMLYKTTSINKLIHGHLKTPSYKEFQITTLILGLFLVTFLNQAIAETTEEKTSKPLNEVKFLGLNLVQANLDTVRSHLWDIGGFLQAQSTVRQRNIDKFFPWSTIRDSYHITFRYNHAGDVVSVKRVYRPYSLINNNKRSPINTKDIALKLIPDLGQPTQTVRKGWGGGPSYPSYTWQDETMQISIDREGSEKLGNVYIEYVIKTKDPYEVIKEQEA
ncbi:hypothetical protein [Thiomicrorhabdus lithotrophica]|uniref:Uncharacterized protein n=1 Tax=Thiomicrorhabdus lithotrophica TaxID=2949997 RepID=A0ABY8C6C4_9GAMM|nr:hypothetical protein [Thiomicrorhabdus lithotrophica]WEJ61536.1 hypothetical protein NR989_05840 [Thiomicrorhabdus lithotrophica]